MVECRAVFAVILVALLTTVTAKSLDSVSRDGALTPVLDHSRYKRADKEETLKSDSSYGLGFYPGYYGYGYGYGYPYGYGYGYPYYGYGNRFYGYGGYGYGYPYWW